MRLSILERNAADVHEISEQTNNTIQILYFDNESVN